ncbi:polyketide cyclase [Actinomycetospora sp. NBRC 106375]|uniref:SRPBCC family protein n=1 Tax=Actinomycetospora sp. NBRC 106375 TaxID=3032207 RepID=UPI0024A52C9B|nr:SRPBCC family protein [Actinomycetospora sp. NBRC 106375]GLZ46129.1 polyketide cyclase [Actinomycetospora sp. NBRC 106375]
MSDTRISVSDTLDAPVERVFALLADPDRHPDLDGSGTVRASHTHLAITEVGDVFVMEMEHPARGHYRVENHVVRYEPDRALAWAPAKPGAQPSGHVWGWELAPTDDDQTLVTHYHDWADLTDPEILGRVQEVTPDAMRETIANLGAALA